MKKIFILNLLLIYSINAQDLHEFSLHLGGGLSTLSYEPTLGDQSSGLDKQFGVGYVFFVSPRFGFATGLELAFYSAEYELNKLGIAYRTPDLYNPNKPDTFLFNSSLSSYTEEQSVAALQIPLMLQFQTDMGFYAMAGVKYSIPISGSASGKGDLKNLGCYDGDVGCLPVPRNRGFGDFPDEKTESRENFENSLFASAEMGMKWRFEDGISLYTGVYFDYGFSNILKKKKMEDLTQMVEYNSAGGFDFNGIFDSQDDKQQAFVTKVMPLAIGVKVKLSLGQGVDYFGNKDKEKQKAILEAKQLEAEKRQLELDLARATTAEKALLERETERLAAAEKLLQEARLAYEKALTEQYVARASNSEEVDRLAAETAQIQDEVTRLSSPQDFPDFEPVLGSSDSSVEVEPEAPSHSGEWVVQVAVVLQKSRAGAISKSLKRKGFDAYYKEVVNPGKLKGTYYRVRVGYFPKMKDAQDFAKANLQTYKGWWLDKTDNDTK